jgi:hypothetical protein
MESARPLRDVFADLTGAGHAAADPGELLRDQGHPALPDDLVAEAVISYADTAPAEVAEHLAPYVTAHSVIGSEPPADPPGWLDLLATAPAVTEPGDLDDLTPVTGDREDADLGTGLDFGTGTETGPAPEALDDATAGEPDDIETVDDEFLELGADPIALDSDVTGWTEDADGDDEADAEPLG